MDLVWSAFRVYLLIIKYDHAFINIHVHVYNDQGTSFVYSKSHMAAILSKVVLVCSFFFGDIGEYGLKFECEFCEGIQYNLFSEDVFFLQLNHQCFMEVM